MTGGAPRSVLTSGFCAERHSAQANSDSGYKNRTVLKGHSLLWCILWWLTCSQTVSNPGMGESSSQAVLFTSEGGFADVDLLFTIAPPDFLTFVCPDVSCDEKHFESIVARVDRWMRNRFITTVMVTPDRNETRLRTSARLMGDLRRISSQLVWVNDGQDLKEVLTALRFF
jgi:hypothetical protein